MKKVDVIFAIIILLFVAAMCSTIAIPAFGAETDFLYEDDC